LVEQDIIKCEGAGSSVPFVSNNIYYILPLPFGAFLAFDTEYVYFHIDGSDECIDARKLRQGMVFSSVLQNDEYD
jgi:hypothetical protein